MMRIRTFALPAVLTAALVAGSVKGASAATDDVMALRNQVSELQARLAELEKRLAEKNGQPSGQVSDPMDPFAQMEALMMRPFGMGMSMRPMLAHAGSFSPDYDVKATDKAYVISFDMPGMDKSKINVEVKNGTILISGERSSQSKEDQGGKFYRQERSFGYFSRVIPLPEDSKAETLQAKYDNGVLNITIEKKEPVKPAVIKQKIEVK